MNPFQMGWGQQPSYVNPQWINNNGIGGGQPGSPPPQQMPGMQGAQQMPMEQMFAQNQGMQPGGGGGLGGFVDQNMDGIDDRIFQAQMQQVEMQSQSEMQQLQAKRQEEYWSAMKDRMMQQQKMQQQAMQNSMMNQPVGQFGQQAAQQQKVTQLGMGTQHPQMQNTFADGFGMQQKSRQIGTPSMTSPSMGRGF